MRSPRSSSDRIELQARTVCEMAHDNYVRLLSDADLSAEIDRS